LDPPKLQVSSSLAFLTEFILALKLYQTIGAETAREEYDTRAFAFRAFLHTCISKGNKTYGLTLVALFLNLALSPTLATDLLS